MHKNFISYIAAVFALSITLDVSAAPLPAGTKLSVTAGSGSGFNLRCTVGACFGIEIAPGLVNWTDIVPGLDGGIIVGKQQSTWPGPIIPELNPCELAIVTAQGTTGCFMTAPAAETNVFDDASCDGSACLGKTEVKSLSLAGFGNLSGACAVGGNCPGVQKWAVTSSAYSLDYAWTIPSGLFAGTKTYLHIVGNIPGNLPPVAIISPSTILVVPPGASVTLDGSQSYDPDGTIVCHSWDIPGVILPAVCDPKVSFYAPSVPQTLTVKLTVTDNLGAQGSSVTSVVVAYELPPYAGDVYASGESGQIIFWKPQVFNAYPPNCYLTPPMPANGTATVASDCSMGTYQSNAGFVGTDRFSYSAGSGGRVGTVTIAVTEPLPADPCLAQYPVSQFSQTGKEGTLTITFTGNITSHTNKVVKLCPGTTLKYQASSSQGPVVCQVKNNTTRGSGSLRINDHIKCTDKPAGKDKVHFKAKSGVSGLS